MYRVPSLQPQTYVNIKSGVVGAVFVCSFVRSVAEHASSSKRVYSPLNHQALIDIADVNCNGSHNRLADKLSTRTRIRKPECII